MLCGDPNTDERGGPVNLTPRTAFRWICGLVLAGTFLSCSGGSPPPASMAPSAKYTISQLAQGRTDPVATIEGRGDFAQVVMADTQYVQREPFLERLTFGNVTYTRRVGEQVWEKGQDAATPEAKALISVRNALLDPSRSIGYLRSVSTEVTADGTERVRGDRTTRHRATVDLGRAGGPPGYLFPLEAWVDDAGRTRRLRYSPLGAPETTVVWELYDFGVPVDVSPPPADKVR